MSPKGLGMWCAFGSLAEKRFGNWDKIADLLIDCGVSWFSPRIGDVGYNDAYFTPKKVAEVSDTLMHRGIQTYPWHYSRPTRWKAEIDTIARTHDLGLPGHIIDAEVEWAGFRVDAMQYGQLARTKFPDFYIAHAPLAWAQYHQDWPYTEFSWCSQVMPQTYWTELKNGSYQEMESACLTWWEKMLGQCAPLAKGYAPIGVTYGRGEVNANVKPPGTFMDRDLAKFLDRYKAYDCVSLYSLEVASQSALDLLRARRVSVTHIQNTTAPPFYSWVGLPACVSFQDVNRDEWKEMKAKLASLFKDKFGTDPL